ncbi:hypothetical protein SAMN05428978_107310 [Nitrosomonas sp. Nm34]|nr:hypothetical protein SAMN05428978_107310 [Nitrosomonas sp. Nm34]
MNWQDRLITIYLLCLHSITSKIFGFIVSQRMSNYADLSFSDEEGITLFLLGVMDKHQEIKSIYEYADRHLHD